MNAPELVKSYLRNTDVFRNPDRVLQPMQPQPQPQIDPNTGQPIQDPNQQMQRGSAGASPSPASVNGMGSMPMDTAAGATGRAMSEAFGGGSFGGGYV